MDDDRILTVSEIYGEGVDHDSGRWKANVPYSWPFPQPPADEDES